jgi:6-phosphofructokinase 1
MPKELPIRDSELEVKSLGPAKIPTPLDRGDGQVSFVSDKERILLNLYTDDAIDRCSAGVQPPSFEVAGPRKKIYFDPAKTKAAIVTCGGLCPGINSVIRAIVLALYHNYGVRNIQGIKFGLQGFIPAYGHPVIDLTPEVVLSVHGRGGCFLGMSRGPQDVGEVVDAIERLNISILFTIGGDGTLKASQAIQRAIAKRKMKTGVIGIPKTIDNDIMYVSRTFGFDTAVEAATQAIQSAHNEANAVPHGIGLVKVMGRHA